MDKRPERIAVGAGEIVGPRAAQVKRSPRGESGRWCCWRTKEDGSFDWVTWHLSKRAARRAARLYERTGKVRGRRS